MRRPALARALAIAAIASAPAMAQQTESGQGGTGLGPPGAPQAPVPNREEPSPLQGCADPSFKGKYSNELRRLDVPTDLTRYGRCRDYGAWQGNAYAGHANLPNGYWVYSYPQWIIYANRAP